MALFTHKTVHLAPDHGLAVQALAAAGEEAIATGHEAAPFRGQGTGDACRLLHLRGGAPEEDALAQPGHRFRMPPVGRRRREGCCRGAGDGRIRGLGLQVPCGLPWSADHAGHAVAPGPPSRPEQPGSWFQTPRRPHYVLQMRATQPNRPGEIRLWGWGGRTGFNVMDVRAWMQAIHTRCR